MVERRRVVVTGLGSVNPLGLNVTETWESATQGKSGVGPITLFDASEYNVSIACEVKGFDPANYMDIREARRRDRFEQFATVAAAEAVSQAGLEVSEENAERIGVTVSTAVGGIKALQESVRTIDTLGPRRVNPFTIPMFMPNGAAGLIAIEIGAQGPCYSMASACASAADGIGQASLLIRAGVVDVCIAGGTEASITEVGVSSFDRLGAMSRKKEEPWNTPRPFDKDRDGLVMGEGAAVLVLESLESARLRGATILAELVGYAATGDAHHITAPTEEGVGGAAAMQKSLNDANLQPQDVDYINAHGTATGLNDISETKAIKSTFGEYAARVPISSTKSMTGHMMGATGALEAIFCVLAIRDNLLPPTINYATPDPECDLDYIPNEARQVDVKVAMSNAFGFGGHNAVLVFRDFSD